MNIVFDPPFDTLRTVAFAAVILGFVFYLYRLSAPNRQGRILRALRIATGLVLLIILLNPVVTRAAASKTQKQVLVLLMDISRSMSTRDAGASANDATAVELRSRMDEAKRLTAGDAGWIAKATEKFDVRVFSFDDRPVASDFNALRNLASPEGARSDLSAALMGATSSIGQSAGHILLVSDGRDTSDGFPVDAARSAKQQGFTIDTLCIGARTDRKDVQVLAKRTQVFAAPGQEVEIGAEVRSEGMEGAASSIGLQQNGNNVQRQAVRLRNGSQSTGFRVKQSQPGVYRYSLAVSPAPGEATDANNQATVFLNVMNSHARILLLDGQPSWDSKFLVQTLRSDPTVTVDAIYKVNDTKYFATLGGQEKESGIVIPSKLDDLRKYDVLILGKGFEEFYDASAVPTLKKWVSDFGGNLVFLRGKADERTEALRELEPVTWSPAELDELRLKLTREGLSHPGFAFGSAEPSQSIVTKLPPLVSATQVQGEKALAVVLARGSGEQAGQAQEMATVAFQRIGQGKTMAIAGQGLWRWAFLPPDLENYRKVYEEFWSQTARWLVSDSDFLPGQDTALRAERTNYAVGETVTLYGYARGKAAGTLPPIQIGQPNGKNTQLSPSKGDGKTSDFVATFKPEHAGEYIASLSTQGGSGIGSRAVITVTDGQEEDLNRSADPDLMRQIASAGGGQALSASEVSELPNRLGANSAEGAKQQRPQTAWDRPWLLFLLGTLLGAEWWIRRRNGLA
jgi:hypothetical protein